MVMEYSFRVADAGVPNSYPPIFPTSAEPARRAPRRADRYSLRLYSTPWFVGDQWFEYVDEPAGGRFDGEDSNFGLVVLRRPPVVDTRQTMTEVHARAPDRLPAAHPACWSWRRVPPSDWAVCSGWDWPRH